MNLEQQRTDFNIPNLWDYDRDSLPLVAESIDKILGITTWMTAEDLVGMVCKQGFYDNAVKQVLLDMVAAGFVLQFYTNLGTVFLLDSADPTTISRFETYAEDKAREDSKAVRSIRI